MKVPTSFDSHSAFMFSQTTPQSRFRTAVLVLASLAILSIHPPARAQLANGSSGFGTNLSYATYSQIRDTRMLDSTTGWVLVDNRLLLTRTAGDAWDDITPHWRSSEAIDGIFFRDKSTGWVLLHDPTQPDPERQLEVASTFNSGQTWRMDAFPSSPADKMVNYANVAHLDFIDAQHGWLLLRDRSSSSFSRGRLFKTSDGGHSWTELPRPPIGDPFHFMSLSEGWIAGGANGHELFVTHDGGLTWSQCLVENPEGFNSLKLLRYELPTIANSNHGELVALYEADGNQIIVRHETSDGGKTWSAGKIIKTASTDSSIIMNRAGVSNVVLIGRESHLSVSRTDVSKNIETTLPVYGVVSNTSFITPTDGWITIVANECDALSGICWHSERLFKTEDGGISFIEITPTQIAEGTPLTSTLPEASPRLKPLLSASPELVTTAANSMAFDECSRRPASTMYTWLTSTPYRAVGFYLGGAHACDEADANWISTVGGYGWKLLPLWVGPQAASIGYSSPIGLTGNPEAEGIAEGSAAWRRYCVTLGLSCPTIIYYDLEGVYSRSDAPQVIPFIKGWVEGLHANGQQAGVYSNNPDFVDITPTLLQGGIPDAIWPVYYFSNNQQCGTPCQTVLNIPHVDNANWANDQRIRQTGQTITSALCFPGYSCIANPDPTYGIDEDWADGPAATTNAGQTLSVSLAANPATGSAPLTTNLTSTVSGTASGTINYSFWWNCSDSGTSVSSVEATCGQLSASCASTTTGFKCDSQTYTTYSVNNIYSFPQPYTAKVIVERGSAPPAESRITITARPVPTVAVQPLSSTITTAQQLGVTVNVYAIVPYAIPTGTVTVTVGNFTSAASNLDNNGSATIYIQAGSLAAGTYIPTANYSGNSTYTSASGSATASVTVTSATKTTPTITWNTPAAITYGTPLSTTQQNATASIAGTYSYSPQPGTVLTAGSQTLTVTFTPTDTTDYNTATKFVTLTVNKATPTITWATPAAVTVGTALSGTQLNPKASVAGNFSYNPTSGTVMSTTGNITLTAYFVPNDTTDYNNTSYSVVLVVNPVSKTTPTITWNTPAAITYGTALSGTQLNASASVGGSYLYSPSLGTVLPAGSQTLNVTFTPSDTTDYNTATKSVTLTVNKATPTITWATPAAVTVGTALSGTQLNPKASVAGNFSYNPTSGTVMSTTGNITLTAYFAPNDTTDYNNASYSVVLIVTSTAKTTPVVNVMPNPTSITTAQQLSVTVSVSAPSGKPTPTGNVSLTATNVSQNSALTNGSAAFTISAGVLPVGSNQTLTSIYTPDSNSSSTYNSAVGSNPVTVTAVVTAPVPAISGILPAFTSAGGAAFTLTVNGSGFTTGSTVYWGTSALTTTYGSATQLTAQVPATDIATGGISVAITVQTPSPGGGTSNSFQLEVDSASGTTTGPTFNSTSVAVTAGSPASYPVTLPSTVESASVTCLNLPTGATCNYSATTNTVTITTSSTTPKGTYQITVVFTETVSGAATSWILLPILLLPLMFLRRKLAARGVWVTACLGMVLLAAAAYTAGCGGGGSSTTTPPPQTHQVVSSGSVGITIQ